MHTCRTCEAHACMHAYTAQVQHTYTHMPYTCLAQVHIYTQPRACTYVSACMARTCMSIGTQAQHAHVGAGTHTGPGAHSLAARAHRHPGEGTERMSLLGQGPGVRLFVWTSSGQSPECGGSCDLDRPVPFIWDSPGSSPHLVPPGSLSVSVEAPGIPMSCSKTSPEVPAPACPETHRASRLAAPSAPSPAPPISLLC